jgi:hypothetical protein
VRKTTETSIADHKYTIGHWPVDKQVEILTKLTKLLGEPIVRILILGGKKEVEGETAGFMDNPQIMDAVASSFSSLVLRLNEGEVKQLLRDIVTDQVLCDGKPFEYNTHFMGRIGHLFKVALAVVRHQYADFLDVLPVLKGAGVSQTSSLSV